MSQSVLTFVFNYIGNLRRCNLCYRTVIRLLCPVISWDARHGSSVCFVPYLSTWNNARLTVSYACLSILTQQLGREPRGVVDIAYRTPDDQPAVVKTAPRLPDGTPFPTLYYLTDPRLTAEASRL